MEHLDTTEKNAMSRREMIRTTGGVIAGMAIAGSALANNHDEKILLGSGTHKYEWIPDWLTPPADLLWGDTQGVAIDAKSNIYISHTVHPDSKSKDAIAVFDPKGTFIRSFGSRFAGGGHGLDLRKEGNTEYLYHCDTAHRVVVKTDLMGKLIWEKGFPTESGVYKEKDPYIPTNVALSPNGDFYVTDGYGSDWICRYDIKGNFIQAFGGKGKEPGKVLQAHGIWVDTRGSEPFVVVADRANSRLQYFTMDGKHIKFVTEGMRQPCHFHTHGDMLLVPDLKSVITLLDGDNKVITQLGDGDPSGLRGHPRKDFIPGKFVHPHSAKFLHNGDILVVEWVPQGRVTLLKRATMDRT